MRFARKVKSPTPRIVFVSTFIPIQYANRRLMLLRNKDNHSGCSRQRSSFNV